MKNETALTNVGDIYILWGCSHIYSEEYSEDRSRVEEVVGSSYILYSENMEEMRGWVTNGGTSTYLIITDGFGDLHSLEELGKYSSVGYIFLYQKKYNGINKGNYIYIQDQISLFKVHSQNIEFDLFFDDLCQTLLELNKVRDGVPPIIICQTCSRIFALSMFFGCAYCANLVCLGCLKQIGEGTTKLCSSCYLINKEKGRIVEEEVEAPQLFIQVYLYVVYIYIYIL